ncbi:MAG TPA: hypothetical protein VIJ62_06800 [Rhizomicrobium sp.]
MSLNETMQTIFDRRLPAAVATALMLQTAGALFWAGSAAERIKVLETTLADDQSAISRVAVLEDQVSAMKDSLSRIENKLDRINTRDRAP